MNEYFRKTKAVVDLSAIRHNIRVLKSLLDSKNQFFCPMVKSNGYGHGDVEVTKVCEEVGVTGVGVALLEEGIRLREKGIQLPIYVFGPILDGAVKHLVEFGLTPVIGQWSELLALGTLKLEKPFTIHLKFNTGMNRLGFSVNDVPELNSFLEKNSHLKLEGVCTHLMEGGDASSDSGKTKLQIENFEKIRTQFTKGKIYFHVWNSSGFLSHRQNEEFRKKQYGVRPGIAIYGIFPDFQGTAEEKEKIASELQLKPAMELVSEVVTVQKLQAGDVVSYGGTYQAKENEKIGVIPIGYGDGYSRRFSDAGEMILKAQLRPIRGTVCMDYTMISLPENCLPEEVLGHRVLIMGREGSASLTAQDLANKIDTIPYEIVTCIGRRVPREFIGGEAS